MHRGQRRTRGVLLYHFPTYSPVTGPFPNSAAWLASNEPQHPFVPVPHSSGVTGTHSQASLVCSGVPGTGIQVLVLVE